MEFRILRVSLKAPTTHQLEVLSMRFSSFIPLLGTLIAPSLTAAQSPRPEASIERGDRWSATITIFRSPGTGVQVSKGHLAAFIAHYPTVIKRDGQQRATEFLRIGGAYYAAPNAATSAYASLSFAPSLTSGWSNSAIADVGLRRFFSTRFSGQLGVALLHAPQSNETRVNPTIGFGVRF